LDAILTRPTENCHSPNIDQTLVLQLRNQIETRATESEEPSSTILDSAGQLSTIETLLRTIRRQRQAVPVNPDNKLPDHMKKTDRGNHFVLHEDKNMIIFTMNANLSALKKV
jgi:hypothetical protein